MLDGSAVSDIELQKFDNRIFMKIDWI